MGQSLSEPVVEKSTSEGNDKRVMYGISSMQGWRTTMEDAHTIIPSYADTGASYFAVFDGHGGDEVAKYSGQELHKKIMSSSSFAKKRIRDAIRIGHYAIDEDLRKDPKFDKEYSGSTAVTALITKDNVLYVSNVGDSRAVISTKNGRGIPLTQDHKPKHPKEAIRIKNAGGFVENGRVNGSLALSRALGDFIFKSNTQLTPDLQAVTAEPDIIEHLLTDHDEFVVLACDGIWDCLSNQQVVDFIRHKLCEHKSLGPICEELIDYCLAETANMTGIGCDNMTVIIVAFLRKRKPQEWYDWMARKEKPPLPPRKPILIAPPNINELTATDKNTIPKHEPSSTTASEIPVSVSLTTTDTTTATPTTASPIEITPSETLLSSKVASASPDALQVESRNTPLSSSPILPPTPSSSSSGSNIADAAKRHSLLLAGKTTPTTTSLEKGKEPTSKDAVSHIMAASAATTKRQSILNNTAKTTHTSAANLDASAKASSPARKVSFVHTPSPTPLQSTANERKNTTTSSSPAPAATATAAAVAK